jgi:ferredoxin
MSKKMKPRILLKENLPAFLDSLLEKYGVIAPSKVDNYSLYRPIEKGSDVCLDYLRPMKSAKEIFFPQNEVLFYFNKKTQKQVAPEDSGKKLVLFGVTSCDLEGIAIQDRLFISDDYVDVYYSRRRNQTLLIGMGCPSPDDTCFCHIFNIDRLYSSVADIFMVPLEDRFFIEIITPEGEELVSGFAEADENDFAALKKLNAAAVASSIDKSTPKKVAEILSDSFESTAWEDFAMRCINCAACTFVCPTCHCFDITDESKRDLGRRMRTWDGCMFKKFTLHASGHNPRTQSGQRMRQRVLHKFSFYNDNLGVVSCTGCGRCIDVCPVNIDIREIIKAIEDGALVKAAK